MVEPNYVYRCTITRVVDGDTVDANIDLGFNMIYKERIRLMGIDTPESRTRNKREKILGKASKARLQEMVLGASTITGKRGKKAVYLQTFKEGKGKFGRILGTLWVNGYNVNDALVDENHARPYFGGNKEDVGAWAIQHPKNSNIWWYWTPTGYEKFDDADNAKAEANYRAVTHLVDNGAWDDIQRRA
jgi:micrococcal nuclease